MINPLMTFENIDALVNFLESDEGGQKFNVKQIQTNVVKIAGSRAPNPYGEYVNITVTKDGLDGEFVIGGVDNSHGLPVTKKGFQSMQSATDFKNAVLAHLEYRHDELNGAGFDIDRIDMMPNVSIAAIN